MEERNTIAVKIMGKTFNVKCPAEKVSELHEAASYLDSKINEIHNSDKVIDVNNLLVIAGLNIAHELILQKHQKTEYIGDINKQIEELHSLMEVASVGKK